MVHSIFWAVLRRYFGIQELHDHWGLFDADIYKEKSQGSAKAQFSIDEVCFHPFRYGICKVFYMCW